MELLLAEIPGVPTHQQCLQQVQALLVGGKSEVLWNLVQWAKSEHQIYRKIIHAMGIVAATKRGHNINEKYLKKCARHDGVYEILAHREKARVMCFHASPNLMICTNTFWKTNSSGNQDAAFDRCAEFKRIWEIRKQLQESEHEHRKIRNTKSSS